MILHIKLGVGTPKKVDTINLTISKFREIMVHLRIKNTEIGFYHMDASKKSLHPKANIFL